MVLYFEDRVYAVIFMIDRGLQITLGQIGLWIYASINQVPCCLAQAIMTIHTFLSLLAFSASVTLPTLSHFVSPSNIFWPVLNLSTPRIHTSKWVYYGTPGLFVLSESRCGYFVVLISLSENFFLHALFLMQHQYCCAHHLILKYSSIWIDPFAWLYSH